MQPGTISKIKIVLIYLTAFLLMGCPQVQVDAYECVLLTVDDQGNQKPLEQWQWFCVNKKTGVEKEIPIQETTKCIRDQSADCKWVGLDLNEREIIRQAYVQQCQTKP